MKPFLIKMRTPAPTEVFIGQTLYDKSYSPPLPFKVTCNCRNNKTRYTIRFVKNNLHFFGVPDDAQNT